MDLKRTVLHSVCICLSILLFSCAEDDSDLGLGGSVSAPSDLSLQVQLSQDNSGLATITPSGASVSLFILDFGDGSESVELVPGSSANHMYGEGSFSLTLTGQNLAGEQASIQQEIAVSFSPPENLEVTVIGVPGDSFSINVSAEADLAVGFEVYFGDVTNEEPTPMMLGETITHTYPTIGEYQLTVVALSGGTQTIESSQLLLIDDPMRLPIDFEADTREYVFLDFNGAVNQRIDNPDPSGINTSQKVVSSLKEEGAATFAGTVIELAEPINFNVFNAFTMDVWSPISGATVKLKIEKAGDPFVSAEVDATTTATNQWETLTFDFSNADLNQEYSNLVIFFDFGNEGVGDTFYYDNIFQTQSAGSLIALPLDFENTGLNYEIIGFEGAESSIEENPDPSGINTSNFVLQSIKTEGAQFFAGTAIPLGLPIDFSQSEKISIKIWSPKADIPVRLKIENSGGDFLELDVNTTVANQWEELVWDFSGSTSGIEFTQVVVFFEFVDGLAGDGSTYYFDDVSVTN
mgnify:CR=1 FL=1